jgi:hypothetical protein
MASLLSLDYSSDYKNFREPKRDTNNIPLETPYFYPDISGKGTYTVYIHEKNNLAKPIDITFKNSIKLKKESIIDLEKKLTKNFNQAIIKEIHERKFNGLIQQNEFDDSKMALYKYNATVIPFEKIKRKEVYSSKEDMIEKWPIFSEKNKYDWESTSGSFKNFVGPLHGFYWVKKDERYYLDSSSFDKMSASDYRELILAAECIKNDVWKPLSYKGWIWFEQFLDEYPLAKKRFEGSCIDATYSMFAKSRRLTYTDLLRDRILSCANRPRSIKK